MTKLKTASARPVKAIAARKKSRPGADTSPDWHYWRQIPHVELWKAVALSCNIEPRRERLADSEYWINCARWGHAEKVDRYRAFHDRLEIATARISELVVASVNMGEANAAQIKLPEFAAWALSMQWEIPQELANIAETGTKASKPAAKSENLGATERGTVQKIIAGFLAQGYSHDKISKPYAIAKEIQTALQSAGHDLSDDTIVNWIKEAAPLLAPAAKK
ncbi:MAG: hypothetical protein IH605_08440 [Burkholderiales bacterium]|nr:hypothetical protein [Burkholderiales bacterium]